MPRPCTCNNVVPNSVWDTTQCQLCWHYHHNERIRKAWDEDEGILAPPLLSQAKSLLNSVAKWGFAGCRKVPLNIQEDRNHICNGCEFKMDDKCGVCGCYLKTKTSWTTESCPLGKWKEDSATGAASN